MNKSKYISKEDYFIIVKPQFEMLKMALKRGLALYYCMSI